MSLKRIFSTLVLVMFIAIGFWGCESEELAQPSPNIRPESYISEVSPGVVTRISWYGTDVDGRVERFEYRWDDGDWYETTGLSETFPVEDVTNPYTDFEFLDLDDEHVFYVRAIDNNDQADLSPAAATMSPRTTQPETQIVEGPVTGATVGPDVRFVWEGIDQDGNISGYEYAIDDLTNWIAVDAFVTEHIFYGLAEGAHIFYVRAVDNLGAVDNSPAQSAFVVKAGSLPMLISTSPIVDGGGWFAGLDVAFSWEVNVDYYGGQLPEGYATFALDDSTGWSDNQANMQYSWRGATAFEILGSNLGSGQHTFYVKVRDAQYQVSKMSISFSAAAYNPTRKILVVNGVADSYFDEITSMYTDSVYWGGLDLADIYFWDLFGSGSAPAISTMPTDNYLGGGGPVTPDILSDFECVIWAGNAFSGDLELWQLTPIYPYLLAGGNVFLGARYTDQFFTPELEAYAQVAWRETEISLLEFEPMFPGLVACTPSGASLTSVFSSGGFDSGGSPADDDVTNYDGSRSYTKASGTSTLLFAHRTSAVIGSFGYVRGCGVWSHPNLDYSNDLTQATLPTTGTLEAKGNFVFLSGRHYRFDHDEYKANMRYIITSIFAIQ
ncbi:MAG: hypothetical protein ABIA75_06225 [Candidatus Neomarinimicrobiota bacterium]